MKRVLCGALFFILGSAGCGITLDPLILRPSSEFKYLPTELGYNFTEQVVTATKGPTVSLWRIKPAGTSRGIIVIVPGNDANKGRYVMTLPFFVDKGWEVILFDYPGFGKSTGDATLPGLLDGTRAVLDYAFEEDDVVIGIGVSLGTAVLGRVAPEYPLTACIFESTMNLYEIASSFLDYHKVLPEIGGIADFVAAATSSPDWDMRRWVADARMPKLFIHSPDDSVTPFSMGFRVFEAAAKPKQMFVTEGDHSFQLFIDPNLYRSTVNGWIDGVTRSDPIHIAGFEDLLRADLLSTIAAYGLSPDQVNGL
jgi:uncharacterized protein